jgi:hypothetical protein
MTAIIPMETPLRRCPCFGSLIVPLSPGERHQKSGDRYPGPIIWTMTVLNYCKIQLLWAFICSHNQIFVTDVFSTLIEPALNPYGIVLCIV